MYDIIIKNGYVINMIDKNPKIVDLFIENGKIVKIGKAEDEKAKKIMDATNMAVLPGLINCHNHAAMTIFRGYSDDTELMNWLKNKIWPIEDRLKSNDIYNASKLACIEMLKSGTTTFNDMYFFMEDVAKAAKETNIRAMLGRCVMDVKNSDDVRLAEARRLYEKYNDTEKGKIKVNIAPHALYTCNKEAIEECIKLCQELDVPMHIHLDETKTEHDQILKTYGMTPTKLLEKYGAFEKCKLILAHCVWVTDEDMQIIKKYNASVVHNPVSNCKLASGIAKINKMLKLGINVSLGTDGAGSTNTLDMFEEMRLCNYLQKVSTLDSTSIDAYEVLKMATINGAKALGMEKEIGSIEVGKKADIILVDMSKSHQNPLHDVISNLVYTTTGSDVLTTIVDGNIVMENRQINNVDEKETIKKCNYILPIYF